MSDTYTCAECGRTFVKTWTDEEALAEMAEMVENFGDVPPEERATVCDDCYEEIMGWAEKEGLL